MPPLMQEDRKEKPAFEEHAKRDETNPGHNFT